MRRKDTVVRALVGSMEGGEFEQLMSDLIPKIYPRFERIEPSFNSLGKTVSGKCDAHIYHAENDTYTAVIYTTQQQSLRDKILDDIDKLKKTKFKEKISHVLVCVNTPIQDEVEDYRKECRKNGWALDPFSLERIVKSVLSYSDILVKYFDDERGEEASVGAQRKFDCGARLKEAREDITISPSRLIEEIDFPSEREWCAIERIEAEVEERYILRMSSLTGISTNWLKHGIGVKYHRETIYDYNNEKIDEISVSESLSSHMIIEPKSMRIALVVNTSEYAWKVYTFGFSLDFWNWIGDNHHIPKIYDLLKYIKDKFRYPYGRVVSEENMHDLTDGKEHPAKIMKFLRSNSYWFEDLFDLDHIYPIARDKYRGHGEWFMKLQNEFRSNRKA